MMDKVLCHEVNPYFISTMKVTILLRYFSRKETGGRFMAKHLCTHVSKEKNFSKELRERKIWDEES